MYNLRLKLGGEKSKSTSAHQLLPFSMALTPPFYEQVIGLKWIYFMPFSLHISGFITWTKKT